MGREAYSTKARVDECLRLSVYRLKEYLGKHERAMQGIRLPLRGLIEWHDGASVQEATDDFVLRGLELTSDYIRLFYTEGKGSEATKMDYKVKLTTTACHFGGHRYWFICPFCNRRVAKLYLPPGGKYFACRHCCDLTYYSQLRSGDIYYENVEKYARNRRKMRERLGGESLLEGEPIEMLPEKPKGMRKATYEKLKAEYEELGDRMIDGWRDTLIRMARWRGWLKDYFHT